MSQGLSSTYKQVHVDLDFWTLASYYFIINYAFFLVIPRRYVYQLGVNSPADIASGRIAEVRSRSMSCNCMTRTSQQECRGILEQQRAGLGDCVMREGKGRTYKNIRKIFFVGAICAALLCGCSVIRIDIRKVRDLPYTVVDEYDVPEEMRQAIADQEQEPFLYTWANEGRLYIARGYGKQDTAGYQIQVDAFYESSNVLVFATTLLGPEPDTDTEQGTTCPYLVIQTDYNPKHVITK